MDTLRVVPTIEVESDRVRGCTPWVAQLMVLFAYRRHVTVDRRSRQVRVITRWFWFWEHGRYIPFERVCRIIYRAQGMPALSPARYLSMRGGDLCDSAFFHISLAIKDNVDDRRPSDELVLFSVWEQQPRADDWIDRLAGIRHDPRRIGDESSGAIVALLKEYLGVPIGTH